MDDLHLHSTKVHYPEDSQLTTTELSSARRFASKFKGRAMYSPELQQWFIWDGHRWAQDRTNQIMQYAVEMVDDFLGDATKAVKDMRNKDEAERLFNHAVSMRSRRRLREMVKASEELTDDLTVHVKQLDQYPLLLNTVSGTVNLRNMTKLPHDPSQMLTKMAGTTYRQDIAAPRWHKFLNEVFQDNVDLIQWVQRAIGYSASGNTGEQCLFLCHGAGANGKSTFLEVIRAILGDYATSTPLEAILFGDQTNVRVMESIGRLKGKRMAVATEVASGKRFNEAMVKRITGEDQLTGAGMFKKAYSFTPQFKYWVGLNHLPSFTDGGHGFQRRLKVIPFTRKFEKSEIDSGLKDYLLMNESIGILSWIIQGAFYYFDRKAKGKDGLGPCPAVDQAVQSYRTENDTVAKFMVEEVVKSEGHRLPASTVFDRYRQWCEENGHKPETLISFGMRLAEQGVEKIRTGSGMMYVGFHLKPVFDAPVSNH